MHAAFQTLVLFIASGLLNACGLLSAKPALPKQVSSASDAATNADDEFALAVRRADIVYFPVEAIGGASDKRPAWKILAAFRRSASSFSVAWYGIEADQQPLLNELAATRDHVEDFLDQLRWNDTGQSREDCKAILRASVGIHQLALGSPRVVKAKLQAGEGLDAEEKAIVPRGFRAPAGGLEDFAERLSAVRGLGEREIANLYRAHLFTEQFAAEKIVTFMREQQDTKLLVFLRRRDLSSENGLPYFVGQKLKLRQISVDVNSNSRDGQPRLLTLARSREGALSWF